MIDILEIYVIAIICIMLIYLFSACYCGIFCYNSRIHSYDNTNLHFHTNTSENTNTNVVSNNNETEEIIMVKVLYNIPREIILDTDILPIANPVLYV